MSGKAIRPLAGLVLATLIGALVVATATPATAHYPQVEASSWCDPQGQPWIIYRAWSWKQDPANDGESGNPDIGVYVEGLRVDGGEFAADNGYEFGGSILATDWAGLTVTVRAQADAPFNNGSSLGSFRETSVYVPVDCLPDEPGLALVSVMPGACWFEDGASRTPVSVSIEPGFAATVVILDSAEQVVTSFSVSGTVELSPGVYSWAATPNDGFELNGVGAGEFDARSCEPQEPPVTDLAVVKTAPVDSVGKGEMVTFVITVTNLGPLDEPHAIAVDILPETFRLVSVTPDQGSCRLRGRVITCVIGPLEAGTSSTIMLLVETAMTGRYVNEVVVFGDIPDSNPSNNRDVEDVDVFVLPPSSTTSSSVPSSSTTSSSVPSSSTTSSSVPSSSSTSSSVPSSSSTSSSVPSSSSTVPGSKNADVTVGEALPFTGIDDSGWAGIGFSLLLLGGLILLSISRRQEEPIGAWVGTTWRSSRRRNTINLLGPGLQDG